MRQLSLAWIKSLVRPRGLDEFGLPLLNFGFLAGFCLVVIFVALAPAQQKFRLYESPIPLVMGACALIALLGLAMEVRLGRSYAKLRYRLLVGAYFIGSLLVQLVVAHALLSTHYTWDSNLILTQAMLYGDTGSIDPSFIPYLAINPNNIGLLAGLGTFFKILHHFGITSYLAAAVLLNVLLMNAAQILTFLTAKLLYGRRVAAVSLLFCFVFISLSMYVHIPYTDTLTVVFPILLVYLAVHLGQAKRWWVRLVLAALIGGLAVTGYLIKPTVIITLIALGLVGLAGFVVHYHRAGGWRYWGKGLAYAAACLAASAVTYWSYVQVVDRLAIVPFPVLKAGYTSKPLLHFFAMGLKTTHYADMTEYGGYDDGDATAVSKLLTKAEKNRYSINLAKQRLSEYGPLGYVDFLFHKANWVLSDATFYAYGEGSNEAVVFANTDPTSRFLRSFMYISGAWYVLFGNVLQVFWLALLLLIAAQLVVLWLNRSARHDLRETIPRLAIFGIILFLLLFEGRSRYLFLYVPVFIVCAMATLKWFRTTASDR